MICGMIKVTAADLWFELIEREERWVESLFAGKVNVLRILPLGTVRWLPRLALVRAMLADHARRSKLSHLPWTACRNAPALPRWRGQGPS
jgi:hypothetical protein